MLFSLCLYVNSDGERVTSDGKSFHRCIRRINYAVPHNIAVWLQGKPEGRLVSSGKSPVVKQHTLPTMPQRHMWLHRLLFFLDSPYHHHQCHSQQQQQQQQQGDVKTPVLAGPALHIPPPTFVYAGLVQPKVELI